MSEMTEENVPGKARQSTTFFSGSSLVLLFGLIMLLGLVFLAWIGTPPPSTAVGTRLPKLDLQPLLPPAAPVHNEDLQGKLTVIHFWGTWCPPCILEFPAFAELAEEFHAHPEVRILSISCSPGAEFDLEGLKRTTEDFLADVGGDIPTYSDSAAKTRGQVALLLSNGSLGYPTTLLVNRKGVIIEALEGYRAGDMEKLTKKIHSLL